MESFERRVALLRHPTTPCTAIDAVEVAVSGGPQERLAFTYRLLGRVDEIRLPPPLPPGPADELWRHTCGEAFLARAGETSYRELNFSPSGQWAAYTFRAYRERDVDAPPLAPPYISLRRTADEIALTAVLAPGGPFPRAGERLEIGLAAIVETLDGRLSYWALRHPGDKPDFHSRRGFALGIADPNATIAAPEEGQP